MNKESTSEEVGVVRFEQRTERSEGESVCLGAQGAFQESSSKCKLVLGAMIGLHLLVGGAVVCPPFAVGTQPSFAKSCIFSVFPSTSLCLISSTCSFEYISLRSDIRIDR